MTIRASHEPSQVKYFHKEQNLFYFFVRVHGKTANCMV